MSAREIKPLPAVADVEDLGPAMLACTVGERNWVQAKLETGLSNSECARLAGFSDSSPDVLKSRGYALAHSERVQAALLEQSKRFLKTELPKSLRVILEIRDNKAVKAETRLKAAVEIINRGGMNIVQEGHITHEHRLTDAQIDAEMIALAREAGWTPEMVKLALIDKSRAIDAEFTVVEPTPLSEAPKAVAARATRARRKDMTREEIAADKARLRQEQIEKSKTKYAAAQSPQTGLENHIADGREGLEDIL